MTSSKLRLTNVRATLRDLGITIYRVHNEYRVTYRTKYYGGHADMTPLRAEECASYCSDLEDALGTGRDMARRRPKPIGFPT